MSTPAASFTARVQAVADWFGTHWHWWLAAAIVLLLVAVGIYLHRKRSWLQKGPKRISAWSLNLVRSLRYLSTRREWRYRTPWVLLVGDNDAGKSSITESISQGRRSELLLREAHLAVADSEWAFFDGGVVIDIRDLDDADPEKVADHWRNVLADIDAQRPERPLDALVLTLSAETLLDPPPGGLQALAERSYRRLFELQKRFSFTFPVYVLVTHCDRIDGFRAFWQAQAAQRRHEVFGWSNPYSLGQRFDPAWVDLAFGELRDALHNAQLDAAARTDIADADAFFLFPQRFETLRAPLHTVLEEVFRSAAYHEDFMVRGLYFSGRVETTEVNPEQPAADVAFVDDLFNSRVFRERNLARPTTTGVWSRNRVLRRLQYGMLGVMVAMLIGLGLTASRLDRQVSAAIIGFNAIHNPVQTLGEGETCNRGQVDAIYSLLDTLARIDMDWSYPLIPASWIDDGVVDGAARKIADRVYREIVFPTLRCRLEERARALVTVPLTTIPDQHEPEAEVTAARERAAQFARDVVDLHRGLRDYDYIVTTNADTTSDERAEIMQRFNQLATYAYGEALPDSVRNREGQQLRALAYVTVADEPRLPKNFRKRIGERLQDYVDQARQVIDARVGAGKPLARAIEADDGEVDLNQFSRWLHFANRDWLSADAASNPCALAKQAVDTDIRILVENFNYPSSLSERLAAFERDPQKPQSRGCFEDSLNTIQATSVAPYGSVTTRVTLADADGESHSHLEIAPWVQDELAGLEAVRQQRFMGAPAAGPQGFQCAAPLRGWDGARLAEAAAYAHEYQAFREQHDLPPPQAVDQAKRPLYDRLARRQLKRVLDELANRAQQSLTLADTTASMWLSPLSTGDKRLGDRSRAFALTAPQLQQLLQLYAQFGMDGQGILACARGFANGELDAANRLAEASKLYEPPTNSAALDPDNGAHQSYFDLGTPADTKEYLQQQLQRAQVLAGYAEPFVRFLQNTSSPTVSSPESRQGLSYWLATINEIDRFVQGKDPKGQIAMLNDYVQKDLRPINQANCADTLMKPAPAESNADVTSGGQGLFGARRGGLASQSSDYCTSGNSVLAQSDYQALAKRFNSELAGLFPFGPASNPDAPLGVTKRFFTDYAAVRENLRKTVEGVGNLHKWDRVKDFLDRLDTVADFLNASLAAGARSQPLGLEVGFRYLPINADPAVGGSSQLVSWEFDAGDEHASYPNGDRVINWQFGRPVTLTFTWASLSGYRPQPDATQDKLNVDERQARFEAGGAWSLLRLIAEHRDADPGVADPLDDNRVITAFDVPLKLNQPPGTDIHTAAKLRLALDLTASGKDGKPGAPLLLPAQFPNKAPTIW